MTLSYKTISVNKQNADKQWIVVDASNQVLGRFSSKVAKILRGKQKTSYTPHIDCGDNVIVINANKIKLSGNKWEQKKYIRHTGYPGGQKTLTANEVFEKNPVRVIEKCIKGMLPKNKLGSAIYKNLYVYVDDNHPHLAQKPEIININNIK